MNVLIIETKSGKAIATYPIHIGALDHAPTEQEFFDSAWECAVEDELVSPARRADYTITPAD